MCVQPGNNCLVKHDRIGHFLVTVEVTVILYTLEALVCGQEGINSYLIIDRSITIKDYQNQIIHLSVRVHSIY